MVENYCSEQERWKRKGEPEELEKFLNVNENVLKWIRRTKRSLLRGEKAEFDDTKIRRSLYRMFCKQCHYFEKIFNEDIYRFPHIFPIPENEAENFIICVNQTSEKPFCCLITNKIPNLVVCGGFGKSTQCFPFYTYDKDGVNRRENITDWSLQQFRSHYSNDKITKLDIFHYIYGLLHHPKYRKKYAANLKRELPGIPFAPDFQPFAQAGKKLADLHLNYEDQPEYPLEFIEKEDMPLNLKVEKMKLSKDKKFLIYNDFLTISGIPPETFEYRLGNRSALEWIIDQYQIKTDKRSGIVNDPNQPENPKYILQLISKIIFISLETVKIVRNLSESAYILWPCTDLKGDNPASVIFAASMFLKKKGNLSRWNIF